MENNNEPKVVETTPYDYADGSIYCHKCGKETPINHEAFTNVSGGITIPLAANNTSHLTLSCGHCESILSLHFVQAANPPKEETDKKGEEGDDITENSKEEEPIQGVPTVTELESDTEVAGPSSGTN